MHCAHPLPSLRRPVGSVKQDDWHGVDFRRLKYYSTIELIKLRLHKNRDRRK